MSPLKRTLRHRARGKPTCSVCNEPVSLENSKTDEDGQAIHEECYVAKVCPTKETPQSETNERN